jgi:hypothetical protein
MGRHSRDVRHETRTRADRRQLAGAARSRVAGRPGTGSVHAGCPPGTANWPPGRRARCRLPAAAPGTSPPSRRRQTGTSGGSLAGPGEMTTMRKMLITFEAVIAALALSGVPAVTASAAPVPVICDYAAGWSNPAVRPHWVIIGQGGARWRTPGGGTPGTPRLPSRPVRSRWTTASRTARWARQLPQAVRHALRGEVAQRPAPSFVTGAWPLSSCPAGPGRRAEGSHPAGRCTPPGGW